MSHDRGAVTVGNEALVWQRQVPGRVSPGYSRLALDVPRRRYDVIGDFPV